MRYKFCGSVALWALLVLVSGQTQAHSALESSMPAAGATVAAPEVLTLNFNGDVRLVRVALTTADRQPVELGFTADATASKSFDIDLPTLAAGAYTVNWAIVGADGHTVGDKFSFTVDPGAGHENHGAHGNPGTAHENHGAAGEAAGEHQH